jgi:type II secretory pathway pseudopilin PulG
MSLIEMIVVCVLIAVVGAIAVATQRGTSSTDAAWQKLRMTAEVERDLFTNRGAYSADPVLLGDRLDGVNFTNAAAVTEDMISVGLIGADVVLTSPSETGSCLFLRLAPDGGRQEGIFEISTPEECHAGSVVS